MCDRALKCLALLCLADAKFRPATEHFLGAVEKSEDALFTFMLAYAAETC